jgi:hypothetical protein
MSGEWRPPSSPAEEPIDFEKIALAPRNANPDSAETEKSALALLEMENSTLRRLVVELIEKNQKLREKLRSGQGSVAGDSLLSVP